MIFWILESMAEAIVISTESDADDLSKGSAKVRNAASEGHTAPG